LRKDATRIYAPVLPFRAGNSERERHASSFIQSSPNAAKIASVSEKSPEKRLIGKGATRTTVGTDETLSPIAVFSGSFHTSTTSI
jgi:hypothetical protein